MSLQDGVFCVILINWFDNYNVSLEAEDGEVVLFKGTMTYIRPAE